MLSRPAAAALVVAHLLLGGGMSGSAWAGPPPPPGTTCPPDRPNCEVHSGGSTPPSPGPVDHPGGGGTPAGTPKCLLVGQEVPCFRDGLGWFSSADGCYWNAKSPQPQAGDVDTKVAFGVPADWKPGMGSFYDVTCPDVPGANRTQMSGVTWRATPPPGFGGGPDLAALAAQAVTLMRLRGADIGLAPKVGSKGGTVGLPVWMWNNRSPQTTGPTSASTTAMGVTVTATATVAQVVWVMGDGTTVTCAAPGTPYDSTYGMAKSPDCGHVYQTTSARQGDGQFHLTATTTWAVHWVGGGQQGDLTTTRTSQAQIPVGELQVVS